MKVAVVGGGISGLTAAYQLKKAGVDVRLYEKSNVVGGSIRTSSLGTIPIVEEGADAFLTRSPFGIELCEELGIAGDLVSPVSAEVLVAGINGLQPLIQPHILGVPTDIEKAPTDIESAPSLKADWNRTQFIPIKDEAEETVGSYVRERVGDAIYERQVAPLISAISASDPDLLSLEIVAPILKVAGEKSPSLMKGLREISKASQSSDHPAFCAPKKGMAEIVNQLSKKLADNIQLNTPSQAQVQLDEISADAIILAVPGFVSCDLLSGSKVVSQVSTQPLEILAGVEYVSVGLAQLVYSKKDIPKKFFDLAGILVSSQARGQFQNITAVSFATQKWSHYTDEALAVLRVSVGRYGESAIVEKSDSEILGLIQTELAEFEITALPKWSRVTRWHKAFPQYFVGHLEKMALAEAELAEHNIYLAGAVLRGVGIPACIESGFIAANKIIG